MIQLHNIGIGAGAGSTTLIVNETEISAIEPDPVEESRTLVVMLTGSQFLVSESVDEIIAMIRAIQA